MRISVTLFAALVCLSVCVRPAAAEQTLLSEADIKRVVAENSDDVKHCYKKYALKQRRARGKVKLKIVVTRDGKVQRKSISVRAPGVRGRKFKRCVRRRVRSWAFPSSSSPTEVQYPFFFLHSRARR